MRKTPALRIFMAGLLAGLPAGCARQAAPVAAASAPSPAAAMCVAMPKADMHVPVTLPEWAAGAQLFDRLGNFHRTVSTRSAQAQKYFDQGMRLLWGFNHDEATRSFAEAATLDPDCAACYWGVALTVGPNYNVPYMAAGRAQVAWDSLQAAHRHAAGATAVERALIDALDRRYPNAQALDASNIDAVLQAYAAAMADVARRFPRDLDVQVLYAEALMNVHAWKLWTADHQPAAGTLEILRTLEGVLRREPNHPGANHYYVHAMEASGHPERAVAAAERLGTLMPGAGHMDHMPSHILQLLGRYEESAEANRRGIAADQAYFAQAMPPDYYAMYTGHNYQFLASAAAMEGREAETLDAVRKSRAVVTDRMLAEMPGFDWPVAELYGALVRFGQWSQLLAEPAPGTQFPALRGGYLYGRGVAQAATGQFEAARATQQALEQLIAGLPADAGAGFNSARDVLGLADLIVQARIAEGEQHQARAIALLREAVEKEDGLAYDEPTDWFFPVRHLLGGALLRAHQAWEAEAVYRVDLKRNPDNGWSLYGLAAALRMENKPDDAAAVDARFRRAWRYADVQLTASAY